MLDVKQLRQYYMKDLPIGYSKRDIEKMSDDDLLDMHYFLNEDEDDVFPLNVISGN